MAPREFFSNQEPQSVVKTEIVANYFGAWSKIVRRHSEDIGYADLFSGPGRYDDGTESTPLLILRTALDDPYLRDHLVMCFNDIDAAHIEQLSREIGTIKGAESLGHPPRLLNEDTSTGMLGELGPIRTIPTFYFIDPFGYRGLTNDLVRSVIAGWGCECVLFFNYNRVNAGITNPTVVATMDGLFGRDRAERLRRTVGVLSSSAREKLIVEELSASLRDVGGEYVLPFRFRDAQRNRTSHYVVFVSKHFRGYDVMKEVMAKKSVQNRGFPTFEWAADRALQMKLEDFDFDDPYSIGALKRYLLEACEGRQIRVKQLYEQYSVNTPYLESHFKEAIRQLEASGEVGVDPPAEKRPKRNGIVTVADKCLISFG